MTDAGELDDAVTSWLRRNAIPLRYVAAGNGFGDLQPLRELWSDVSVIGLGESTHGTREFFQVKHRLVEFLVTEMGFTVFAMEASHAACEPLNAWVQGGDGDLDALLAGIHYLAWHTEEFAALVAWLREWNAAAPGDRTVTFLGADVTYNERGRDAVLAYLKRVAPEKVPEAERTFAVLSDGEAKWPTAIDDATNAAVADVLPAIDALIAWLDDHRDTLASRSPAPEVDRIRFSLELMPQWWRGRQFGRTSLMGGNLVRLLDRDHAGERAVYWAHNGHIDAGTYPDGMPKAGHLLRERFGDAYYACALEFGEGSYQYRALEPGNMCGDLTTVSVGPPPDGTIPWHLGRTGAGNTIVNLRAPADEAAVREWLGSSHPLHSFSWLRAEPPPVAGDYVDFSPCTSFDGLLYVERSTPVRPTATALARAVRGERF